MWSNPSFALFSEPNEPRQAFVERCREEAERRIEDETERLEGTFRRRIDQVRELSERDERDTEEKADPRAARHDQRIAPSARNRGVGSSTPSAASIAATPSAPAATQAAADAASTPPSA